MTQQRTVRIGGGSAGLGDGIVAIPQLLRGGELDYLMLDYLSEYFMPQAGRSRQRNPRACAAAIREAAQRSGLDFKIAVVDGDDVIERAAEFRTSGRLKTELPE